MNKCIVHMDHSALKYLFAKKDAKARLLPVDYLSKWVEAKALPTNDARVVCKFLKSLFARFGAPRAIISDRGTHFFNDQFKKVMRKYGVTHRLSTAYHPQTSGQVELTNRGLKRILERTIGQNRASWLDKLDDALWAFRTAYKTPIGCTPYKLVYGKQTNFNLFVAGDHRKIQLNELNELRDHAYENSLIYKEKTKRIHDSKIKNHVFNVGDQVLLFNSRLNIFSGKLKSRWSGPFTIAKVFPYGTVELSQANGPNFKVNGHRIKHYFGGDVSQLVKENQEKNKIRSKPDKNGKHDEAGKSQKQLQSSSSMSSQFVTSMLNLTPDAEMESIFETTSQMDVQTPTLVAPLPMSAPTLTPSTIATITTTLQAPTPLTTAPSTLLQDQPNFGSLFGFDHRLKSLEANFFEFIKTNQFAGAVSSIPRIALVEAYESDKIILDTYGDTITLKRRRDDYADKDEEPSVGSDPGPRDVEKERSQSQQALPNEPMQTTFEMEEPSHPEFETSANDQPIVEPSQHPEWFSQQKKPPTPDRDSNKTLPATYGSIQPWISELVKQSDSRSSFNELIATLVDFSAFLMNRLKVNTLTRELLAGPTYELMKGSCKSLQYPHNLLKPLPLIPNSQGRHVIPFDHFINNDPEYLREGASSRKYTTSVTKTKATNYGYIKWIEDLVPRTMWIQEPVGYDKHALWGISH
nr:reverse transcriptase domain-containing protein [Tanacetum cinerariifolium]